MLIRTPLVLSGMIILGMTGCSSFNSVNPTGTGPFDSRGNYIEGWADDPSKWNGRSVPKVEDPETKPAPQVVRNDPPPTVTPRPEPTRTATPPKPKPKPKPKPAPSPKIHTVRKGDTLYGLAKKYGTTVGSIQRTNGIKGSTIRIGQKIKIPR